MAKKRSYQRRKVLHDKITNWILFSFFALLGAVFLFFGVRQISVVNNIESRNTKTYTGSYTITELRMTRNTQYKFTLGNGDRIIVDDISDHRALNGEPLCFEYAGPKNGMRFAYTGVEIAAQADGSCFLSREAGEAYAKDQLFVNFLMVFLCLLPLLCVWLPLQVIPFIQIRMEKRRKQ